MLLWPVAAAASVVAHGVALVMVRTLAIQAPALPEGETAPLPIQLVTLSPDLPPPAEQSVEVPSDLAPVEAAAAEPQPPVASQPPDPVTSPPAAAPDQPPLEPFITPTTPQAAPVAPPLQPAPAPSPAAPVSPAPPRPAPVSPAPPAVEASPSPAPPSPAPPSPAPPATDPSPEGAIGQGGQVVPVGIRLNPNGRDIPDAAPQLLGTAAIDLQPLASGCGFANLEALLSGAVATSVQMQIRVETSGEISDVRLLQGTGSDAVDSLVGCVVKQRLRLQPASSAGVPQLTDAFILDARIQFF
ncbi:MAG: hypothetical protein WBB18_00500 [Nodosilinea sp.]